MKKRDKFILGGIGAVALSKIPTLNHQNFDIVGLIGLVVMGAFAGLIGYAICGRDKKKPKGEGEDNKKG